MSGYIKCRSHIATKADYVVALLEVNVTADHVTRSKSHI